MEAKEHPTVSGRHAKTRALSRRVKLGGAIIGVTAISSIAVTPVLHETHTSPVRPAAVKLAAYPQAKRAVQQVPAGHNVHWTPSAADALKLALAQVGVHEDANGGGTIYQNWFTSSPWAVRGVERDGGSVSDYADANWCDMFISWIGAQLNIEGIGADAFTPTHAQWFKDRGRWGQAPSPGAIVFFSWSGGKTIDDIDHVGMVIKDNHDGTILTVEGNTDDAVKVRTRDVSAVVGYGYPDYATAKSG